MFTRIEQPDLMRQIVAQIKRGISTGQLNKGDKLPSERQMTDMFGLSRATVRESVKALSMLGLVECNHGSGNYISSNLSNTLTEPLSIMFMLEKGTAGQTHELRRAIEFGAAGAAARNMTSDALERLESLCRDIEASTDEVQKASCDQQFHFQIVEASRNPLLVALLNAAESLISEQIHDARSSILRVREKEVVINRQHREILKALHRGDGQAAEQSILLHMELISENMSRSTRESGL